MGVRASSLPLEVRLRVGDKVVEADLRNFVMAEARLHGWLGYFTWTSLHSPKGFPDVVCVRPPRLVIAELKGPKGKPTPEQVDWLTKFAAVPGVEAYLWRLDGQETLDEIQAVLA